MAEIESQKYLQLITKKLVCLTAACLLVLFIFFYIVYQLDSTRTYLVVLVFFSGLVGGFVSIQQRLPNIKLKELSELSNSWLSILLIPINGGIFALVLMLMFLSGILEGSLFPKYQHITIDHSNPGSGFWIWLTRTFPETGPDIAKLLFWSFVAGFSERFVPQIIRKTAKNADDTTAKKDE